ncbi:MAG: phosphoribosyltransferase domain-containing protein, partial [Bacteroidia bacterium]|nr:phosphoribosyltransferase domain-containing protein [Bacteroidia bacterium]
ALRLSHVLQEKEKLFLGSGKHVNIKNKTVILVDDGIATGNTLLASIKTLRKKNPEKIIVAVPLSPKFGSNKIKEAADGFLSLINPEHFDGVGAFYEEFKQVEDEEVVDLLVKASV